MNILITGASGWIGSNLVEQAAEQHNHIWAIGRNFANTVKRQEVSYCQLDLADPDKNILKNICTHTMDVVIHAAGQAHVSQNELTKELFQRNNIDATRMTLQLACQTHSKRFIHISSVAVAHSRDMYAASKKEAEEMVINFCCSHGIAYTIIRPVVVFGEGDRKGNVYKLIAQINRGVLPLIGGGTAVKNMVYIRNLIEYIDRIMGSNLYDNAILTLRDLEQTNMKQLCYLIKQLLQRQTLILPISDSLWSAMIQFIEMIQIMGFFKRINLMSLRKANSHANFVVDELSQKITEKPPFTLQQGLFNTIRWYKQSKQGGYDHKV
jgi:nucleoside-diphosphate-sugar epimerase